MKKVKTLVHPQAVESLKRYKSDIKAGHLDAAEYWRGQAGAYFTANPVKVCSGSGMLGKKPRFYPAELIACPICRRTFVGLPPGYPIPVHRPYKPRIKNPKLPSAKMVTIKPGQKMIPRRWRTNPTKLVWDNLHPLAKEEIAISAGFRKEIAKKKWNELDKWVQLLLSRSIKERSKNKVILNPIVVAVNTTKKFKIGDMVKVRGKRYKVVGVK